MSAFSKVKKNKEFSKNNYQELRLELLNLLRKRFYFYTQFKIGQLKQTHLLRGVRRDVARIKFLLLKSNSKKHKT
ncbi:50S ribosomal protein L29 [Blochmannia endosymbiont of Polyrhachis (Hedomyrma) turneri]|uniref:50S ribosomal protein L29 n=1 Tax=Blochmannia endosymbiont of Polyrhachis (Hedomyrma) turneri TaxID=1505596 RepID=UPI00061A75AF|nr:50S ribosomal protein L29 [Blochmannia endosymbiont of Polyrhachis (Hedomyrma) turneri]AKC59777.1 50S ribosomal protein L29 [Blochmannia endosymbiont of Polyrhachis (Hedomyrma) turneri]